LFSVFKTLNSFKKHLNTHNYIPTQSICNLNVSKSTNTNTLKPTCSINLEVNTEPDISILVSPELPLTDLTSDFLQKELQKNALCLFSKWYSNVLIPRNVVNDLLNDIQCFNDSFLFLLKTKIQGDLFKLNASSDNIQEFSKIFQVLSNPFCDVKTEYFRLQTLESMGFLIRPYEIVIGQRLNDRLRDGMVVLEPIVEKLTMVSLRLLLKIQLEHSNFFDIMLSYLNKIHFLFLRTIPKYLILLLFI